MKQEIKKRWVAALRSGEYRQGKIQLKKENKFCCLGVLCDIVKDELNLSWVTHPNMSPPTIAGEFLVLPCIVSKYVELADTSVQYQGERRFLEYLNDTENLPFDKLALLIEEQL